MGKQPFYFIWSLIIPTVFLTTLGLVTLLSIDSGLFYQQLFFAVLGFLLLLVFSRIDFSLYQYLDKFIYFFCLLLLILSYFGPEIRGATRWITIGSFQFQPSEFVKPFFIVCFASFMIRFPPTKLKNIILHFGLFLLPFMLILRQPDLGTAIIYTSIFCAMLIISGIPLRYIFISTVFILLLLPLVYQFLHTYQKVRLQVFVNPLLDPKGAGYNALQSMISVGSGKLFGRGFGRGTQSLLQFLPERHTDFIFATFAEEFGLAGSLILLALFFYLLTRILKQVEEKAAFTLSYYYLVGFFMLLFSHLFINVGMNIGILPITGITLPFVSAGGSSLIALAIGLGITMSCLQRSRMSTI